MLVWGQKTIPDWVFRSFLSQILISLITVKSLLPLPLWKLVSFPGIDYSSYIVYWFTVQDNHIKIVRNITRSADHCCKQISSFSCKQTVRLARARPAVLPHDHEQLSHSKCRACTITNLRSGNQLHASSKLRKHTTLILS